MYKLVIGHEEIEWVKPARLISDMFTTFFRTGWLLLGASYRNTLYLLHIVTRSSHL